LSKGAFKPISACNTPLAQPKSTLLIINDTQRLSMHDLTLQFEHWCEQNGHQPWTTRNFKKALKERGFEEGRQAKARGFINLKFN